MPDARKFVYWDACVILSYLEQTPDRLPVLDELLSQSEDDTNELRIISSTLSIVEVAFIAQERRERTADPAVEAQIESIWDGSAIDLVEFFADIARDARTLMRKALGRGWSLKPADAAHLSSDNDVRRSAICCRCSTDYTDRAREHDASATRGRTGGCGTG